MDHNDFKALLTMMHSQTPCIDDTELRSCASPLEELDTQIHRLRETMRDLIKKREKVRLSLANHATDELTDSMLETIYKRWEGLGSPLSHINTDGVLKDRRVRYMAPVSFYTIKVSNTESADAAGLEQEGVYYTTMTQYSFDIGYAPMGRKLYIVPTSDIGSILRTAGDSCYNVSRMKNYGHPHVRPDSCHIGEPIDEHAMCMGNNQFISDFVNGRDTMLYADLINIIERAIRWCSEIFPRDCYGTLLGPEVTVNEGDPMLQTDEVYLTELDTALDKLETIIRNGESFTPTELFFRDHARVTVFGDCKEEPFTCGPGVYDTAVLYGYLYAVWLYRTFRSDSLPYEYSEIKRECVRNALLTDTLMGRALFHFDRTERRSNQLLNRWIHVDRGDGSHVGAQYLTLCNGNIQDNLPALVDKMFACRRNAKKILTLGR